MTGHPDRLEPGTRHVLAWCAECPPWRRLTADRPAAQLAAAAHLELVHGAPGKARAARLRELAARARHADNG